MYVFINELYSLALVAEAPPLRLLQKYQRTSCTTRKRNKFSFSAGVLVMKFKQVVIKMSPPSTRPLIPLSPLLQAHRIWISGAAIVAASARGMARGKASIRTAKLAKSTVWLQATFALSGSWRKPSRMQAWDLVGFIGSGVVGRKQLVQHCVQIVDTQETTLCGMNCGNKKYMTCRDYCSIILKDLKCIKLDN